MGSPQAGMGMQAGFPQPGMGMQPGAHMGYMPGMLSQLHTINAGVTALHDLSHHRELGILTGRWPRAKHSADPKLWLITSSADCILNSDQLPYILWDVQQSAKDLNSQEEATSALVDSIPAFLCTDSHK